MTNAVIWRKMVTNDTVTARFVLTHPELRLVLDPPESGSIVADPLPNAQGRYPLNQWVKLTAISKPGYRFSDWRSAADPAWGGANVTNAVIWRKMVTNDTVTARFSIAGQMATLRAAGLRLNYKTLEDGHTLGVSFEADPGVSYTLEGSTDLQEWAPVSVGIVPPIGTCALDLDTHDIAWRFLRVRCDE